MIRWMTQVDALSASSLAVAGGISGAVGAIVCSPIELIMLRLQTQDVVKASAKTYRYTGPIDCMRHVVKTEGLSALYKGFGITLQREFWSMAVYFASYGALRGHLLESGYPTTAATLLAGGTAGTVAQLISLPIDAVKVRLQTSRSLSNPSALHVAKTLYTTAGLPGFFRGLGPVLLRAFPANAVNFLAFETTLKWLNE